MNRLYISYIVAFCIASTIIIGQFFSNNAKTKQYKEMNLSKLSLHDTLKTIGEEINTSENNLQIIKYYKKENQTSAITKQESSKLIEFYKVFIDNKSQLPITEEHYLNYRKNGFKRYSYSFEGKLEQLEFYNIKGQKISEQIYHNNQTTSTVYYKYNEIGKLEQQSRLINNQPEGKWLYYNNNGQAIKEEIYKSGNLQKYWIYEYNKQGSKIKELLFDKNHKNQYTYKAPDSSK